MRLMGLAAVLFAATATATSAVAAPAIERFAPPPATVPSAAAPAQPAAPVLPDARTPRRALRHALELGQIEPARYRTYRRDYRAARRAVSRLSGRRRLELAAVLEQLRAMTRGAELTASRMEQAFLVLRRNTRFWTRAPLPVPGERLTFGRDPLVFQAYPGRGLQLQLLASFGRANALAKACLDPADGLPCRPRALRRLLDRLVAMAAARGGEIPAWESWYGFHGAAPGWVSGMTQGTAVQALTRGTRVLGDERYVQQALRAVRLFALAPPQGVAVSADGGQHYVMYSTLPVLHILNGHLQAVTGLRDLAVQTGDPVALRAYREGERAARAELPQGDTGAWSLYGLGGAESSLSYHELTRTFLGNLCRRTNAAVYCDGRTRFDRYLREPPRVDIALAKRLRRGRPVRLAFTLSKVSDVALRVRDRAGTALVRRFRAPRGTHALGFTPRWTGRGEVTVVATSLSGVRGRARGAFETRLPRPRARGSLKAGLPACRVRRCSRPGRRAGTW